MLSSNSDLKSSLTPSYAFNKASSDNSLIDVVTNTHDSLCFLIIEMASSTFSGFATSVLLKIIVLAYLIYESTNLF